ncbi:MAG: tripartite tricarboxylate transporter substrate binding protein [Deltaproteobacteria bacterium]
MQRKCRIKELIFPVLLMIAVLPFYGTSPLQAQNFPTKPINLVIPSSSGGQADLMARLLTLHSTEVLGQPMIIQVRPGGGGAVGTELVYQSKPDGYTLSMGKANWSSILPALEGRSRGPEEMDAVCRINSAYTIYFVQTSSPFKKFQDVIDYAKANPGKLTYGNSGVWSLTDLEWRWIEKKAGIQTRNVAYDGGGASIIGLLGWHVMVAAFSPGAGLPHYRAGKLRPLCIAGPKRLQELPNVPTLLEEGFDTGLDGNWQGILAPKETPKPVIDKLAAGFKKMTENKQAIEGMAKLSEEFGYMGSDEFAKYWRKDYQIYKDMAKMFK